MTPTPTATQQAAIAARDQDVFVVASAGSGKTETLARRCAALLSDRARSCEPEELLVVTFTRAAAAEVRVRVSRRLAEALTGETDAAQAAVLQRRLTQLEAADICTIDAWCARIVRANFAALGVDPQFGLFGEQGAADVVRQETLDELLRWVYAAADGIAQEAREWLRRGVRLTDECLRRQVNALNKFRDHLTEPDAWLRQQRAWATADEAALARNVLTAFGAALGAELEVQVGRIGEVRTLPDAQPLVKSIDVFVQQLHEWRASLRQPEDALKVAAAIGEFRWALPKKLEPEPKALFEKLRKRCLQANLQTRFGSDALAALRSGAPWMARWSRCLIDLEARFEEGLQAEKRARGMYEFGDVMRMALNLLGAPDGRGGLTPTALARRQAARYRHILVDEYQDTSPLQDALLRLVARTQPGNRFLVGDIKQSIYGFRLAEPRLFGETIAAARSDPRRGQVLALNESFRAHGRLLEPLNRLFASLFDEQLGGLRYDAQQELRAKREELSNPTLDGQARLRVHVLLRASRSKGDEEEAPDEDDLLEEIEREALVAAREIAALREQRVQVLERSAAAGPRLRALTLDDVVVLLRAAKVKAGKVAALLRDCGVPAAAAGRESVLDVPEARDLVNLLSLLGNRRQDYALCAYLRGPLVGLDERALLAIRRSTPDGEFLDAVQHYLQVQSGSAVGGRLTAAFERLERWTAAGRALDVATLLQQIITETAHDLFAAGRGGGAFRLAALRALQQRALDFDRGAGGGPGEFAAQLEALEELDAAPDVALPRSSGAVRVMTVHAAKGLEFPVVFVLGAGTRFNAASLREDLLLDPEAGLGLRFADALLRRRFETVGRLVTASAVERAAKDEELRLLYVAATRAQERLYIVGHSEKPAGGAVAGRLFANSHLDWVLAAGRKLADSPDYACRIETGELSSDAAVAPPVPVEPAVLTAAVEVEADLAVLRGAPTAVACRTPAVASVSLAKQRARAAEGGDETATVAGASASWPEPGIEAADGRALGTACHRFLQHVPFAALTAADRVDAAVRQLVQTGRLSAVEAELLPQADLAWFGATDLGRALEAAGDHVRRELAFTYAAPWPSDDDRMLLRGVVDCLLERPDGLVLLDYKTDRRRDAADWQQRIAGYATQLQLYGLATAELFARPVRRMVLVFLRERELVEVPWRRPDLAQLFEAPGVS